MTGPAPQFPARIPLRTGRSMTSNRTTAPLRREGWRYWTSDAGRSYATRETPFTRAQEQEGCSRTVSAETPGTLADLVEAQERHAEKIPS